MKKIELVYNNLDINNLPGEIWVDAYDFDGYYEVSNMGRIKTCEREVSNGVGTRIVISKIRKQVLGKDDRLTCPFTINNESISINVSRLIFQSFNPTKILDNLVVSHRNRCKCDNRLNNLKVETLQNNHFDNVHKYNYGLKEHLLKLNKIKHEKFVNTIKSKVCNKCGIEKDIIEFVYKREGKRDENRNICKMCRNKRERNRIKK